MKSDDKKGKKKKTVYLLYNNKCMKTNVTCT